MGVTASAINSYTLQRKSDSSCPYISVINSVGGCHHFVGGIHCMWEFWYMRAR